MGGEPGRHSSCFLVPAAVRVKTVPGTGSTLPKLDALPAGVANATPRVSGGAVITASPGTNASPIGRLVSGVEVSLMSVTLGAANVLLPTWRRKAFWLNDASLAVLATAPKRPRPLLIQCPPPKRNLKRNIKKVVGMGTDTPLRGAGVRAAGPGMHIVEPILGVTRLAIATLCPLPMVAASLLPLVGLLLTSAGTMTACLLRRPGCQHVKGIALRFGQ